MIFVLLALLGLIHGMKLPDEIIKCNRSDPEFSDCIGKSITQSLQILANGYTPMKVPAIEPFFLKQLEISEAHTHAISVVQKYRNCFIHGITRSNISNMRMEVDKGCGWDMDIYSPHIYVTGDMELKGHLLMLPLDSLGQCNISLINCHHHHTMQCERYSENGKVHLRVIKYSIDAHPESIHYDHTNLFPSNKQIEKAMLVTINDNALSLFNEIKKDFEKAFSLFLAEIANLVFDKVSMDELFL